MQYRTYMCAIGICFITAFGQCLTGSREDIGSVYDTISGVAYIMHPHPKATSEEMVAYLKQELSDGFCGVRQGDMHAYTQAWASHAHDVCSLITFYTLQMVQDCLLKHNIQLLMYLVENGACMALRRDCDVPSMRVASH